MATPTRVAAACKAGRSWRCRSCSLYAVPEGAHEKLWKQLDITYFLRHDAREIAWHTRLLNYRVDTKTPVVKARLSPVGEGVQVMIYAPDQKSLFAQICSFFERINFSIVEAKIYTTLHGYALDTFQVMDPARSTSHYRDVIAYIEHELTDQLKRGGPLPPPVKGRVSRRVRSFPVTPEVSLRPDEKGNAYYLSFMAGDRPGLLSSVARVLVEYGSMCRLPRSTRWASEPKTASWSPGMRCAKRATSSSWKAT